jgi:hypothetical protein
LQALLFLILLVVFTPVFAEPLSDRTGFKSVFEVMVEGKKHNVEITGNFDVTDMVFENGKLTFDIHSSISDNFGEMTIPHEVVGGDVKYYVDGNEFSPKVLQNNLILFVTLSFEGEGQHTLVVEGTPVTETPPVDVVERTDGIEYVAIAAVAAASVAIGMMAYKKKKSQRNVS